jgi:hypothetical protein
MWSRRLLRLCGQPLHDELGMCSMACMCASPGSVRFAVCHCGYSCSFDHLHVEPRLIAAVQSQPGCLWYS